MASFVLNTTDVANDIRPDGTLHIFGHELLRAGVEEVPAALGLQLGQAADLGRRGVVTFGLVAGDVVFVLLQRPPGPTR